MNTADFPAGRASRIPAGVLLLIAGLALLLRFFLISKESLWLDEAASWWFAQDFSRAFHSETTNPPLYYTLLYFWTHLFGTSEAALRSLSVIPNVLAILVTFRIADKLFTRRVALIAALYQTVSVFQIYYAQEARAFSVLLLFLSLAFLFLLEGLDSPAPVRPLAGYAVCITLALYTHFIATFFIASHALYVLVRCRRNPRRIAAWIAAAAAGSLLFIPWLVRMLQAASGPGQLRRHLFLKVPQTYFSFFFGDTLIPLDEYAVQHIRETLTGYAPHLILAVATTAALSVLAIRRMRTMKLAAWLALPVMGIVPIALSLLVSLTKVKLFDERYVIACSPFVYMFVALGLSEAWAAAGRSTPGSRVLGTALILAFTCLCGLSLWNYFFASRFGREQWREAVRDLESTGKTAGSVLVLEPDYLHMCTDYYRTKPMPEMRLTGPERQRLISGDPRTLEMLDNSTNIWLIRSHHTDNVVLEALQRRFRQESVRSYSKANGIEVYRFSR